MELGAWQYLGGVLGLALVVASLWFAAARIRAALFPGWVGSRARVAEAVLFTAALTVLLQLLGAVGLLTGPALLVGAGALGAGLALAAPRLGAFAVPSADGPPRESPVAVAAAAGLATFAVAHWATGVGSAWSVGMQGFDTLWYHGPFAARFAAEGSILPLHLTDAAYLNWFYPQNSELQHAAGIVLFGRDLLSPWISLAFLCLGLLAAWAAGRARAVAVVCLAASLLALDSGALVPRSAGTAANDIAPISLLLAAAALLVSAPAAANLPGRRSRAALPGAILVVCGLAVGVAVGTKLTMLAPAAGLAAGLAWTAPGGARLRSAGLLIAGVAVPSVLWFARNLASAANPLPFRDRVGPVDLPGPERGLEGRDPFNVAHYLFDTSTAVETSFFADGLASAFGPLWPVVLGLAVAGVALALWRGSVPIRALAFAALAGGLAYLFTPLTAAGAEGQPLAFEINLRYAVPALALGLVLLPLDAAFSPRPGRSGRLSGPALGLLAVLLALFATIALPAGRSAAGLAWERASVSVTGSLAVGLVVVGSGVGLALLGRRSSLAAAAVGLAAFCALAIVGLSASRDYLESRYVVRVNDRVGAFSLTGAARWAAPRDGDRIALVGSAGAYHQYPLFGASLGNDVRYVAREAPNGGFEAIVRCREFIRTLNAGGYDSLVVTPTLDLNSPGAAVASPELGWVEGDPNAREVRRRGNVVVFVLEGALDPRRCPARNG